MTWRHREDTLKTYAIPLLVAGKSLTTRPFFSF